MTNEAANSSTDENNSNKNRFRNLPTFLFYASLYVLVAFLSLFAAKYLFASTGGDLARWLTFATIVQAVIASAAIVGISAVVLIYTSKATDLADKASKTMLEQKELAEKLNDISSKQNKIIDAQTEHHKRASDISEAKKLEADMHQLFDPAIETNIALGKVFALYDALVQHRISIQEAKKLFYDYQVSLVEKYYTLSSNAWFLEIFSEKMFSIFKPDNLDKDLPMISKFWLDCYTIFIGTQYENAGILIDLKEYLESLIKAADKANKVDKQEIRTVSTHLKRIYEHMPKVLQDRLREFIAFSTVANIAESYIISAANTPSKIDRIHHFCHPMVVSLGILIVKSFQEMEEDWLRKKLFNQLGNQDKNNGIIDDVKSRSPYFKQMMENSSRRMVFGGGINSLNFERSYLTISVETIKGVASFVTSESNNEALDDVAAKKIASRIYDDKFLDSIFTAHYDILFNYCSPLQMNTIMEIARIVVGRWARDGFPTMQDVQKIVIESQKYSQGILKMIFSDHKLSSKLQENILKMLNE